MINQLEKKQLKNRLSLKKFEINESEPMPDFRNILGQPRATKALEFGVNINHPGYNLYVAGESGIGRTSYVLEYLKAIASRGNTPNDWLYINNFDNPLEPRCLSLPENQGRTLQKNISHFIEEVLAIFPAIFEHTTFLQKKTNIEKNFDKKYESALQSIERLAQLKNIALYRTEEGINFVPLIDGKMADEAALAKQDDAFKDAFYQNMEELEDQLNQAMLELPQWQRELNNQLVQLHQLTINQSLKPLFEELQKKYQGHAGVLLYIAQLSKHLPRVISEHLNTTSEDGDDLVAKRKLLASLYLPNVFISSNNRSGLPIILESNPSYANLFGHIRSGSDLSGAPPGYQDLVAGAFHRANGGFLLFDVEKVLQDESSWETLKRIIREGQIKIEPSPHDSHYGVLSSLQPEYISLDVKVILLGSREVYYHLSELDPDFDELFRILVDFGSEFEATSEYLSQFAYLIMAKAKNAKLAMVTTEAIQLLAEYACRLAEHQNKLSTHIKQIMDVAIEANYWCKQQGAQAITVKHINKAIDERKLRHSRLCEQTLEEILSGALSIVTTGSVIGQVNGLSVIQVAESRFGSPIRITATVHPGTSGVVDIEREVSLGQPVHSKGIMLLSSFLRGRYAKDFPLAISAHIAIEQSYGDIDGDSASVAELCALLSALVSIPLRQDIAITGAVSQFGEVQSIGGVNEKIEGFFDLCRSRGLTGEQGVIIPASNQINLMLNDEVINAVQQKKFCIYTVETLDEAMFLLTGKEMGQLNASGEFSKKSINGKIVAKLKQYASLNLIQGQDVRN